MRRNLVILMCMLVPLSIAHAQNIQPEDCEAAPPFQLEVGGSAIVQRNEGRPVNVRANPSVNAEKLGEVEEGALMTVLNGPVCGQDDNQRYAWYEVDIGGDITGWIAEGDAFRNTDVYFIAPPEASNVTQQFAPDGLEGRAGFDPGCPVSYPTYLRPGDTAIVNDFGGPLRLRLDIDGAVLDEISAGTQITLLDGPECGSTYAWWEVELPNGQMGYVAEGDKSQNPRVEFISFLERSSEEPSSETDESAGTDFTGVEVEDICPTQFGVGANAVTNEALFVYTEPLFTAEVVATANANAQVMLTAGPLCGDSGIWWKARLSDGSTGWLQEADAETMYLVAN